MSEQPNNKNNIVNKSITTKKVKKTTKLKKDNLSLIAVIDGDQYFDLNTEFKWSQKLTDAQKLFVFYYSYQSSLKKNASEAVRQAGYSKRTAKIQAAKFLNNPEILAEIKNIQSQLLKNLTKANLKATVIDIIERKKKRMNVNPFDFYHVEKRQTSNGYEYTDATPKTPEEIADEQKENILDIEFVGQRAIMHYKLADKIQAENEILKIFKDMEDSEEQKDDFEVETTAEIIKGNLQLKTKVMKANASITELSDLNNKTTIRTEED